MKSQSELGKRGNDPSAPDRNSIAGAPRWVKILGFIALAFVAVVVVLHLTTGGFMHHARPSHVREHSSELP